MRSLSLLLTLFACLFHTIIFAQSDSISFYNIQFNHLDAPNELPNDKVWKVFQDSKDFIWIGTHNGLVKWDGVTRKIFMPNHEDSTAILGTSIMDIVEDKEGYLWFLVHNRGLSRFDPKTETFKNFQHQPYLKGLMKLYADKNGIFWMGSYGSGMFRYDKEKDDLVLLSIKDFEESEDLFRNNSIVDITEDITDDNILWCGGNNGLYRFNKTSHKYEHFPSPAPGSALMTVNSVLMENPDTLWLGTWGGGIVIFHIPTKKWTYHTYIKPNMQDYAGKGYLDNVKGMVRKSKEEFWIQTGEKGGGIFNTKTKKFTFFQHDSRNPTSIKSGIGNRIFKDREGRVWFCFEDVGISYINPGCQAFFTMSLDLQSCQNKESDNNVTDFGYDPRQHKIYAVANGCYGFYEINPTNWSSNNIPLEGYEGEYQIFSTLLVAKNGTVWVGGRSDKGNKQDAFRRPTLLYLDKQKGKLVPFQHPQITQLRLQERNIIDFYEDAKGNLWIASNDGALIQIIAPFSDKPIIESYSVNAGKYASLNIQINQIIGGQKNNIWVATNNGLFDFDLTTATYQQLSCTTTHDINTLAQDSTGLLWLATKQDGLRKLHPQKDSLLFPKADNLPYTLIDKIAFDNNHQLWLTTQEGVYFLDKTLGAKEDGYFQVYNKRDGLAFNSFFQHGFFPLPSGDILLGQKNSYYRIQPSCLIQPQTFVPVYITKFQFLDSDVNELKPQQTQIKLPHHQNEFIIHFSSLTYCQANKVRFSYMLEGIHDSWHLTNQSTNQIHFNSLKPGAYTFKIRRVGFTGSEKQLKIIVRPPAWFTTEAYIFYLLLGSAIFFGIRHFFESRKNAQKEAKKLKEEDAYKTAVYSNITHEIRTPLTSIIGYAELIEENAPNQETVQSAGIIKRNGNRLLNLVHQVLNLRKAEAGKLQLNISQNDIIPLLHELYEDFSIPAQKRGVKLVRILPTIPTVMDYDKGKIVQIISNLLSNAIKFTPVGGQVDYQVKQKKDKLVIQVRDTGEGIAETHLPRVFDRYFSVQTPTNNNTGTGIGLALVRELVHLMDGSIEVESTLGEGSTFLVILPIKTTAVPINLNALPTTNNDLTTLAVSPSAMIQQINEDADKPLILITEDNEDVAQFTAAVLGKEYQILFAKDGQEGIEKAIEHIPDLIISDVMMPRKDGFELCQILKTDERTCHIPIIMLTAKAGQESKIDGLTRGADAYLTKPFSKEELRIWVQNLLKSRIILQARYANLTEFAKQDSATVVDKGEAEFSKDDAFIKKVYAILEKHAHNSDWELKHLYPELKISRAQLYRKMKALTEKSLVQILQEIRLENAKELLTNSSYNITEITYKIGFKDPSHFTKVFQKSFNRTPTDFRNNSMGN